MPLAGRRRQIPDIGSGRTARGPRRREGLKVRSKLGSVATNLMGLGPELNALDVMDLDVFGPCAQRRLAPVGVGPRDDQARKIDNAVS